MATDLTITLPDDLVNQVRRTAEAEGKTVAQVIQQAAVALIDSKRRAELSMRWQTLSATGQKRALELKLTEEDVPRLIAESRNERR
jgi:predicted site-specific integrase-resolvase